MYFYILATEKTCFQKCFTFYRLLVIFFNSQNFRSIREKLQVIVEKTFFFGFFG